MTKPLQVVIPVREGGNAYTTLRSLGRSTFQDFDVVVVQDQWGNANAARNAGAAGDSEFLLFSDDDIEWKPDAIGKMVEALRTTRGCVAYGPYEMAGRVQCRREYSWDALRVGNFISTMSVMLRKCFNDWDESLHRLQDWEMWIRIAKGYRMAVPFIYVGPEILFHTAVRDGITRNGAVSYQDAERIVKEKHGL